VYKVEHYTLRALRDQLNSEYDETKPLLEEYLNSKPSTWRLISHSVSADTKYNDMHYFVWFKGE
jgi:hypothetical protein